ncbi:membrane protein, TerC family [Campylobacter showae]|uniref:Integral membrane protein, TerC family n=1 Tax=Campylobacter showae RM3277 TaxID=553219 RepID=C6RI42_9BACT|nr:TerC/Alx family metal homeostasis membrane protein [Campylobacter showae]EET79072.1 integral membrane protein, TerC family [Campylobacter showae RM3277]QCD48077.1 membrane protein, TerC family [Campylobacter showae]
MDSLEFQTMIVFIIFAVAAFAIDFFAHKKDEKISLKQATLWSIFWIVVSVAFGGYLYFARGSETMSLYFAGYILEKSLSVDNLFVMMAIFSWFKIPEIYRHRVLYFGIIGAVIFRLVFVAVGTSLLGISPWMEFVFAAMVAYSAVMMMKKDDDEEEMEDYSNHLAYRAVYRFFPVFPRLLGHSFFVKNNEISTQISADEKAKLQNQISKLNAKWIATPLFLCLCVIELSDVMFAFDSVPAVIAVSKDPLIVYSAMIFAILGLRTLYFVLEALKDYLAYLEKAVIVLLFFIAAKLALNASAHIFHNGFEISAQASLWVILAVLGIGIFASLFKAK